MVGKSVAVAVFPVVLGEVRFAVLCVIAAPTTIETAAMSVNASKSTAFMFNSLTSLVFTFSAT